MFFYKNHKVTAVLALTTALSCQSAWADDAAAAAETPDTSIQGYVEASYTSFNSDPLFANCGAIRVFDNTNGFTLNQVALNVAHQPKEGWGYAVNLIAGKDADVFAPFPTNPGANNHFDFPQAFVQYASGSWTTIAGRFVTLAGAETIDPRTDSNYSRSILFGYAIPFAHTGVRTTYAASDTLNIILGVNNGWDDLRPTTGGKTLEAALAYTPSKQFNVTAQSYVGDARIGGLTDMGKIGTRSLIDVVATWTLSDAATIQLNGDWGSQTALAGSGMTSTNTNSAQWHGLAGYFNYQFTDQWHTSMRAEYLDDIDGYRTGTAQMWKEVTFTLGYSATKFLDLRLEMRHDYSNGPTFINSSKMVNGQYVDLANGNSSVAMEAILKFSN